MKKKYNLVKTIGGWQIWEKIDPEYPYWRFHCKNLESGKRSHEHYNLEKAELYIQKQLYSKEFEIKRIMKKIDKNTKANLSIHKILEKNISNKKKLLLKLEQIELKIKELKK